MSAIIKSIVWGLLIGILINCFLWYVDGYHHLMREMNATYQQQITGLELRDNPLAADDSGVTDALSTAVHVSAQKIAALLRQSTYVQSLMTDPLLVKKTNRFEHAMGQFVLVIVDTGKLILAKFLSIFASFWVLLFASILGAMDGLLARYIRTHEGGRESTYIFHRVSDSVMRAPVLIVFFYLTIPLFFNPEIVVVVMSILFFLFFYIATSNLKKFL